MPPAVLGAWSRFTPQTLEARFEPARRAGAWSAIVDSLELIFQSTPASLTELPDASRALLLAELDSLHGELAEGEHDAAARLNGRITTKRFAIELRVFPPQRVSLFSGRAPGPIVISALPEREVRPLCWLTLAINDLVALYGGPARAALAVALGRRTTDRKSTRLNSSHPK